MDLYAKIHSRVNAALIPHEDTSVSISLIDSTSGNTTSHVTVPPFANSPLTNYMQRSVYYISDLHLSHHVLSHFKETASEDHIRAYVHDIVLQLFTGDFVNDVRSFRTPIVLFGGDVSSSFDLAEIFYRDFLDTWVAMVDNQYALYTKDFLVLKEELDNATRVVEEWKEKHSWVEKAKRPIAEYSEKKVPRKIKALDARINELKQKINEKREKLGLSYAWESDYKATRKHQYVYAILGNHELWDFESYDTCETSYKQLFAELDIVFLNNAIYPLGAFRRPILLGYDSEAEKLTATPLRREDDPKKYDSQLYNFDNILIVGGLGFASENPSFNALQGIYGTAVSREEELVRCKEWRELVSKAAGLAVQNHCSLVILSHTPVFDWMPRPEEFSNCFVFSGHTHKNVAYGGENNFFVFADNQIGYGGRNFSFKKATLHIPRNPLASKTDGFWEISCDEYKEYYRYVRETLPGTGIIEKQIALYKAKLYVIKQDDYVGFFLVSPLFVHICNGGQIRGIGPCEPLDRYVANFKAVIDRYMIALSPLRQFQERLSSYIKSLGGNGYIHGTIVDIDFQNHVMINPLDGALTFYNSPKFGVVNAYPDIGALIHAHCPALETAYQKAGSSLPIAKNTPSPLSTLESVDIKNSPYAISRKVNALQRLVDKHILRDWNPDLEIIKASEQQRMHKVRR